MRGGQSVASGFDCSGLVRYVMSALDVAVPRTAAQQAGTAAIGLGRDAGRLRPGDLLTFGRRDARVSHVGIYVGNGRYVHASSVAGRVIESDIDRPQSPLVKAWRGTRRVLVRRDARTRLGTATASVLPADAARRCSRIRAPVAGKSSRPSESASAAARAS